MAFQDTDLLLVNRSSASYKADVSTLKDYLVSSGVGATVTASDSPPGSPNAGDIWWNSTDGNLYLYYQDADSSQWVPAFSVGAAGGGEDSPVQSVNSLTGDVVLTTDDIAEGTLKYSRWGTSGSNVYVTTGNVGVGTSTPGMPLSVVDSSGAPSLTFDSTGALSLGDSATQMVGGRTAGGSVYLQGRNSANAAANFTLNPLGGNIGIGTDSPTAALSLRPTQGSTSVIDFIAGDTTSDAVRLSVSGNINNWSEYDAYLGHAFKVQGSTVLSFDSTGGLGLGSASPSDYNTSYNNIAIRESGDSGITIDSGSTSSGAVAFTDLQNGNNRGWVEYDHNDDSMHLGVAATDAVIIDSAGDVGIGGSPDVTGKLVVESAGSQIALKTSTVGDGNLVISHTNAGALIGVTGTDGDAADAIRFSVHSGDEAMRVTTDGDLLIGGSLPGSPNITLDSAGDITTSGNVTANNVTAQGSLDVAGAYTGSISAVGASNIIDCSLGNYFTETVAGAVTFSFSNVPSGKAYGLTLEIDYQSGSIAWPASVYWPLNTAPTLNSGNTQLIVLITSDGGTTWRGNALSDFAS